MRQPHKYQQKSKYAANEQEQDSERQARPKIVVMTPDYSKK